MDSCFQNDRYEFVQRSAHRVNATSGSLNDTERIYIHSRNAEEGKTRGEVRLAASRYLYIKVTSSMDLKNLISKINELNTANVTNIIR